MIKSHEIKLRSSLSEVLDLWWDKASAELPMPMIGPSVLEFMGEAALSVLFAIEDTQTYMEKHAEEISC